MTLYSRSIGAGSVPPGPPAHFVAPLSLMRSRNWEALSVPQVFSKAAQAPGSENQEFCPGHSPRQLEAPGDKMEQDDVTEAKGI